MGLDLQTYITNSYMATEIPVEMNGGMMKSILDYGKL